MMSLAGLLCFNLVALAAPPSTSPAWSRCPASIIEYQTKDGGKALATTPQQWRIKREKILAAMQEVMGPLPKAASKDVPMRVVDEVHEDGVRRLKIRLTVEPGDEVPAYLLIPDGVPEGKRAPAMLALHQTIRVGKDEPAGVGEKTNRRYGIELARRGYVVLCPDYPSFGEYKYDFKKSGYASGTVKGIFNHMRCVDYLMSRPEVDPERIGVIGHSLGGHNAIFVGAFDERLKVIVSSCGWTPFRSYYGGDLKGWTSDRYMPRIRDVYGNRADKLPFEFEEIVATLAPRAFFSNSPLHDANFDVNGVREVISAIEAVYEIVFHLPDRLVVRYPDSQHDFPPEVRQEAYRFIDLVMEHKPSHGE